MVSQYLKDDSSKQLFDIGYTEINNLDVLARAIEKLDAVLIDVRLSPRSRNPMWTKKSLVNKLGDRYIHAPDLGNLNYKGGGIDIKDIDQGIMQILHNLSKNHVILMCVCSHRSKCHRANIVGKIEKRHGVDSIALTRRMVAYIAGPNPPGTEEVSEQLSLFVKKEDPKDYV